MKILAVCGSGLGSSFMLEMNIEDLLKKEGITDIEVEHSDVTSATPGSADLYVVAKDIADSLPDLGDIIVLNSIIDIEELKTKLFENLSRRGII